MGWVILGIVVLFLITVAAVHPQDRPHSGRPGDQALLLEEALRGRPRRLQQGGGLPGGPAHAGPALQALAGVQGGEVSLGAGARGRDRRRHRPGRPAPAHRGQVGRLPEGARQLLGAGGVREQPGAEGRAAPGAPPGHHGPHPPGGLHGHHQEPGLRPARLPRPEEAGGQGRQALPAVLRAGPLAAGPGAHLAPARRAIGRAHRHGGHRHHLRGRPPAGGRHRQPPGRVRRRAPAGSERRGRPRAHRRPAGQQEQPAQQLPGLPGLSGQRRQHRPAARPPALRGLRPQPLPGGGGTGAHAGGGTGRSGGDQGLRGALHRGHLRAWSSSSVPWCGPGTAASGRSRCAPASTP